MPWTRSPGGSLGPNLGGACSGEVPALGGRLPAPGGVPSPRGACSQRGVCGEPPPRDGYCCGDPTAMHSCFITVLNEVAKVMFLQVYACPHGGGGVSASVHARIPPPEHTPTLRADTPLGAEILLRADTSPRSRHLPGSRHPSWSRHPLRADSPRSRPLRSKQPPRSRHTPGSRHPPPSGSRHPPPRDGHCCGRYASYWNAFLYLRQFTGSNRYCF